MSIVIFHFSDKYKQLNTALHCENGNGWRIAVEFFFVVSGFLLAYKCETSDLTAWEYTKRRFGRFYPDYLFTMLLTLCLMLTAKGMSCVKAWDTVYNLIDESMLLQGLAWNYENINIPTWYISTLLVCGYFIYYLLKKHNELFTRFIAPLTCLIAYSYLSQSIGRLSDNVYIKSEVLGLSIAVIRGFAGISAGVISYELYKTLKKYKFTKLGTKALHAVEVVGFLSVLAAALFKGSTHMDFYFVIFFIVCTALAFSRSKKSAFFNNDVVNYLSKISFDIYLIHIFVIGIFKRIYKPEEFGWPMFILFLISTVAAGAICNFVCTKTVEAIKRKRGSKDGLFIEKITN